jgi:hypothetical protein
MQIQPVLLPQPRHLTLTNGIFDLNGPLILQCTTQISPRLYHAVESLKLALPEPPHSVEPSPVKISITVDSASGIPPQGYDLSITENRIHLTAEDEAGVFYGICTLKQLIKQYRSGLPSLEIHDSPDFPVRGVMLDISRDKVPTMDTLRQLIGLLAGWKITQIQLYMEHTFAYSQYPEVWAQASPFTPDEIRELDRLCADNFIELVPNQNSFGHMTRWLIHPRFASLAELQGEYETPWGNEQGPYSLCPIDPGSLDLVESLYDELLPNFTSRYFNVGCDETFDVGQGRSKEACEQQGKGRVYLDFVKKIHRQVEARNHTMLFWADILLQYPELTPEVPKNAVALDWGYEADHPFTEHARILAETGISFYVCPGTSSWDSIAGRTDNALQNLRNAAQAGIQHGAAGYLNTDWGDNGHWQMLPVSYIGFAGGAAYSWALNANKERDLTQAVSLFAFDDAGGQTGKAFADLGNIYHFAGFEPPNSSTLFWLLQKSITELQMFTGLLSPEVLNGVETAIDQCGPSAAGGTDGNLVNLEYEFTRRLLRHACRRGRLLIESDEDKAKELRKTLAIDMDEITKEYSSLWLARNRPGGLSDSLARFDRCKKDYFA